MGSTQHPKKDNLVSEPSIMEDPSPKKLHSVPMPPHAADTIQSNWVGLVTHNAVIKEVRM